MNLYIQGVQITEALHLEAVLDELGELHSPPLVPLGNGNDQPHVVPHQQAPRLVVVPQPQRQLAPACQPQHGRALRLARLAS